MASPNPPAPLKSEALLIGKLDDIAQKLSRPAVGSTGLQALVVSPGRAQLAHEMVATEGFESVQAWYVDLHDAAEASGTDSTTSVEETDTVLPSGMDVLCGADLPDAHYDFIAMPILKRSEAEWTRDLLQQAHQRLPLGGVLAVAVDHPKDHWLHDQMQAMFDKVTSYRDKQGCVYWGKKSAPLRKIKDFGCQFAFRDHDRLIQAYSRPGVFSHRRLDNGARQLLLTAEIGPEDHVLDMGCGCGTVALAAAFQTTGQVFGVDSNARAIQCLKRGAELNQLENINPVWNADGSIDLPVAIDVALANPPYFAEHEISQHFVDTAIELLRPGGALLAVTKQPSWYEAYFSHLLEDVVVFESSRYFVACGRKPGA